MVEEEIYGGFDTQLTYWEGIPSCEFFPRFFCLSFSRKESSWSTVTTSIFPLVFLSLGRGSVRHFAAWSFQKGQTQQHHAQKPSALASLPKQHTTNNNPAAAAQEKRKKERRSQRRRESPCGYRLFLEYPARSFSYLSAQLCSLVFLTCLTVLEHYPMARCTIFLFIFCGFAPLSTSQHLHSKSMHMLPRLFAHQMKKDSNWELSLFIAYSAPVRITAELRSLVSLWLFFVVCSLVFLSLFIYSLEATKKKTKTTKASSYLLLVVAQLITVSVYVL